MINGGKAFVWEGKWTNTYDMKIERRSLEWKVELGWGREIGERWRLGKRVNEN